MFESTLFSSFTHPHKPSAPFQYPKVILFCNQKIEAWVCTEGERTGTRNDFGVWTRLVSSEVWIWRWTRPKLDQPPKNQSRNQIYKPSSTLLFAIISWKYHTGRHLFLMLQLTHCFHPLLSKAHYVQQKTLNQMSTWIFAA